MSTPSAISIPKDVAKLIDDAITVLRAVDMHFYGTDAPLGVAARDVLRRHEQIEAVPAAGSEVNR